MEISPMREVTLGVREALFAEVGKS
jgi:hypothetical protein